MEPISIFWFRRDLRLDDNAGLYHALKSGRHVLPIFILDTDILDQLLNKQDARLQFIMDALHAIQQQLLGMGATLCVLHGKPVECLRRLLQEHHVVQVFANHDYEPYAINRDSSVQAMLQQNGVSFHTYKDQIIFERGEVLKDDGTPYTVFTPYSKRWKQQATHYQLKSYPTEKYFDSFVRRAPMPIPSLADVGFKPISFAAPSAELDETIARNYDKTRDIPGILGTTRLSVHLRFGTISVRKLTRQASELNEKLLNELIWREFYMSILWHFPYVVDRSFKQEYDSVLWDNDEEHFSRWCAGMTGVPIVDAGMRELNSTGYMHNRVRMITASFLVKNLLIDWRWGEAYFAEKLLDFDLSSNNGSWQWVAGSGCDAAPYFRVFNPMIQTQKFDPELKYIKKWVPEWNQQSYPRPIIDLAASRDRCLAAYKVALDASR
jgi:deoxyribodipyrimidine photo-lyase